MMPKDQDYVKNLYKKTISIIHIEKILFFSIKKKSTRCHVQFRHTVSQIEPKVFSINFQL